jgi:hypothetical protein
MCGGSCGSAASAAVAVAVAVAVATVVVIIVARAMVPTKLMVQAVVAMVAVFEDDGRR